MIKEFRLVSILIFCFLYSCGQTASPPRRSDSIFRFSHVNLNPHCRIVDGYLFHDKIILFQQSGETYVLDSSFKHVTDLEQKLNKWKLKTENIKVFNDRTFIRTSDDSVVIFDSNFSRVRNLENQLRAKKLSYFVTKNDSMWFVRDENYFQLLGDSIVKVRNKSFFREHLSLWFKHQLYSDTNYNVYACNVGEFGGNGYFENRHTGKIYSLPIYLNEVVAQDYKYHLICGFDYRSKYMVIENPEKLFPKIFNKDFYCCNCDSATKQLSRVPWNYRKKWFENKGVFSYFDTSGVQTVVTFVDDSNRVYSTCFTDSSIVIIDHSNVSKPVQVEKRHLFNGVYTNISRFPSNRKILCTFSRNGWTGSGNMGIEDHSSGFILVNGHNISVFESHSEEPKKIERAK